MRIVATLDRRRRVEGWKVKRLAYESTMDRIQLKGDYRSPEEIQEKFIKPQLGIPADLQEEFKKVALAE